MGARDTDPVDIAIPSGILLLGLPQDARLARVGSTDPQAMVSRLREARIALQDPMIAGQLRRLAARAQVQIPTGLDSADALIDAVGVALVHKTIIGLFLARAPIGPPVAAPAPKPAPSSVTAFAGMSAEQRIRLLLERTPKELAPDLARAFRSLVTVEALAGIAAGFVVLLAAQFVGVGEIADAALAWWAYSQAGFSGLAGLYEVLRAVVAAVRTENEGAFDQAVKRFAEGLTLVGVALLTVVVTRAARKRAGGVEGGGGDGGSSFSRPEPAQTSQRWPIAPAAAKPKPAIAAESAVARFGNAASNDYRGTFFAANPELEGQVVVHHAVEQQVLTRYPGVVSDAEMHSVENLRGIPKEVNSDVHLSQIRREWNQFYRQNANPTQQQLLDKATEIDTKYGSQFNPPR